MSLETLFFGERKSNLEIKIVGFENLDEVTRKRTKEKLEDYKANFIVTNQGYLRKGQDRALGITRSAELNLNQSNNLKILLGYKEEYGITIYYYSGTHLVKTNSIIKDWKGLRLEEYIPVLKRPCPMEREPRFAFA